jgi:hypothetical protein
MYVDGVACGGVSSQTDFTSRCAVSVFKVVRRIRVQGAGTVLKSLLPFAALLSLPIAAFAQPPMPPKGVSGTVVSVDGDSVTLQDKDSKTFVLQMTPGWTVSVNRTGDADTIKPGDFVATTNVPLDSNSGKSTELRILEPGYRPEEGTHAVSATNPNLMTHGTVKSATKTAEGVELEVTYPSGSRHIVVPPGVAITVSDPLDRSALKPGVAVSSVTRPGADGVPRASRLQLVNK